MTTTRREPKHCCACTAARNRTPIYCHIGKAIWCRYHQNWYRRRDELIRAVQKAEGNYKKHLKRFKK